jgi:hypothetical protein
MITEIFPPVNFPIDGPEIGSMLIFRDATPRYLKANFIKWCEIGLAEVGASCQLEANVIKHMQSEFVGLINAVHCIALTDQDETKLEENYHQYVANYYKKGVEKVPNPAEYCIGFFNGITKESAKSILWRLMEFTIASNPKHEYQREQKEILSLYERYSGVIELAHDWA